MEFEDYEELIPPVHRYPREEWKETSYPLEFSRNGSECELTSQSFYALPRNTDLYIHTGSKNPKARVFSLGLKKRSYTVNLFQGNISNANFQLPVPIPFIQEDYVDVKINTLVVRSTGATGVPIGKSKYVSRFRCNYNYDGVGFQTMHGDGKFTLYIEFPSINLADMLQTTFYLSRRVISPVQNSDDSNFNRDFAVKIEANVDLVVHKSVSEVGDNDVVSGLNGFKIHIPNDSADIWYTNLIFTGFSDSELESTWLYKRELISNPERSKFAELVMYCIKHGVEFADLLGSFMVEFDLDYARGKQLDFIGEIVGASRKLPFIPQVKNEDGSDVDVDDFNGIMNDEDYRLVIQARIAMNIWDGTNEGLQNLIKAVYKDYQISFNDKMDGTFEYVVRGKFSNLQMALMKGDMILPRPGGIKADVKTIDTFAETKIHTDTRLAGSFMSAELEQKTEVDSNS